MLGLDLQQILKEFPVLRDNNIIIAYAAKAIGSPPREHWISVSAARPRQKTKACVTPRSSFTSNLSSFTSNLYMPIF